MEDAIMLVLCYFHIPRSPLSNGYNACNTRETKIVSWIFARINPNKEKDELRMMLLIHVTIHA